MIKICSFYSCLILPVPLCHHHVCNIHCDSRICLVLSSAHLILIMFVQGIIAFNKGENFMEYGFVGRHEKRQVAHIVLFVVQAIVAESKFVAKPHVIFRAGKFVCHTAEKCDWHVTKCSETYLRWSLRAISYHIHLSSMVIHLESLGLNELTIVLNTHIGSASREVA